MCGWATHDCGIDGVDWRMNGFERMIGNKEIYVCVVYVGYDSDSLWNNVDGGRNGGRKYSVLPGLTSADCLTLRQSYLRK